MTIRVLRRFYLPAKGLMMRLRKQHRTFTAWMMSLAASIFSGRFVARSCSHAPMTGMWERFGGLVPPSSSSFQLPCGPRS